MPAQPIRIRVRIGDSEFTRRLLSTSRGRDILRPDASDLLFAGEREKNRIILRTMQGQDYQGRPFAPYSRKNPYYYYPQVGGIKEARRRAAKRLSKRLEMIPGNRLTRTGLGIRFENYEAFKRALGRMSGVVDLYGPRAPHMLQAIVVRVNGGVLILGIYGEEAKRAEGHNRGIGGRLPRREFFNLSTADAQLMGLDVVEHMFGRLGIGEAA